jgi:hypothetical protein
MISPFGGRGLAGGAGVEQVEQPAELRPVGLRAARHFAKDFFASGLDELAYLGVNALAVGGSPGIAPVRRCPVLKALRTLAALCGRAARVQVFGRRQ